MIKKADWLAISKDRTAVLLLLGLVLLVGGVVVSTLLRLHGSDVQIPVRYSGYGTANIYRDQWYTLYAFSVFAVLITTINALLAAKIHGIDRLVSLGLLGFTAFILITCIVVANAVFNLAPSV